MDHDFRELNEKIGGNVPIYFMTGEYDFACTPEMTEKTAEKVKGSETTIMEGIGHFPMCENPEVYKDRSGEDTGRRTRAGQGGRRGQRITLERN